MLNQPFFIPASLFMLFALPLILGLIPPNQFYGVRTKKTLASSQIWYKANRYGGWVLLISSLIYPAVAYLFPTTAEDLGRWLVHLSAFVVPLLLSLFFINRYIKTLTP
uniref:SdpI/YhfL protein family n=1 Tax=Cyanothece sp. (strain PCC 7425 / ATCC 29141) TaxID=395961 RepID=B8HSP3_CYAP4